MFHPDVLAMYRLLMSNAVKDSARNQAFYETGPAPTIASLSQLLSSYNKRGLLRIDNPELAADHFLAMLQGCLHLRSLLNIAPSPSTRERNDYVSDAVAVFLRAYAIDNKNAGAAKAARKKQSVRGLAVARAKKRR
jgi:TetR/AcrR family transcriptional repressor of mexJK operon